MSSFLTYRVGRLLFAMPFGIFGIIHFLTGSDTAGMIPDFIPGDVVWVYLTGAALIGACVCIVAQIRVRLVSLLLALMLLIFALTVHLPETLAGTQNGLPNLLKDLSLAGGALFLAALYENEDDEIALE
mgnify:CR=1 FL=1|tara:strand:+ start:58361 stop:58747 length:387 start_codon:yes stop_codon:yes gene_type:complete